MGTQNQNISYGLPLRLRIPDINVDAKIEYIGVTLAGNMDVPSNASNVGWFNLGVLPGEIGSAVIAGHFDDEHGKPGVFADLNKLKIGDKLYVTDDKNNEITFQVRDMTAYNPGYAEKVFSSGDMAHLNLITCDGAWDGLKKSYSKRLVVFADIVN